MFGRAFSLAVFVVLAWSNQALSGAWPREKGQVFLSLAGTPSGWHRSEHPKLTLYAEYGAMDQFTLAGKALYDFNLRDLVAHEVKLRWHLPERDRTWRKALGLTVADGNAGVRIKPELHFGRGLKTAIGPGWLDVELFASVPTSGDAIEYGSYGVLGLKPHERFMTMLGVDVFAASSGVTVKAIPAIAWEFMPGRHLNIQYSKGVYGVGDGNLELGLWLAF